MELILPPSEKRKVAAVIGDSTFFHSGITPLADLVYNGASTLSIVLDNRTTAMTGRQENPGSGKTLAGVEVPRMDIAAIGRALGIVNIEEVDAYDLGEIDRALDRLLTASGPGLLVNNGACVLLDRTPLGPALEVDRDLCDGCRRCLMIACPSLSLERKGGKKAKVTVDQPSCYGCNLCAEVCPRDAIGAAGERRG